MAPEQSAAEPQAQITRRFRRSSRVRRGAAALGLMFGLAAGYGTATNNGKVAYPAMVAGAAAAAASGVEARRTRRDCEQIVSGYDRALNGGESGQGLAPIVLSVSNGELIENYRFDWGVALPLASSKRGVDVMLPVSQAGLLFASGTSLAMAVLGNVRPGYESMPYALGAVMFGASVAAEGMAVYGQRQLSDAYRQQIAHIALGPTFEIGDA